MIEQVLRLPLITYWLPIAAAVAVAAPLLWLVRPPRRVVAGPVVDVPLDNLVISPSEKRTSFRRGGNPIGILCKRPNDDSHQMHASLVDRSLGGMCLTTTIEVAPGTILSVRPINAEAIVPWIDIEVCACRPQNDCFELGCRFVKVPPYSILLLFG